MSMQRCSSKRAKLALYAAVLAASACDHEATTGTAERIDRLTAECLPSTASAPAGAWTCPEARTLECGTEPPPLYVRDPANPSCAPLPLEIQAADRLSLGTQPVRVTGADGALACETSLTVVDSQPPTLTPKTIGLWPPNHKFHTIEIGDCVEVADACDEDLQAAFIWASSDEPVDDLGDGHHEPDILVDSCQRVQVRSERQGPKNGRVYKLGVRVVDRAGHAVESACTIIVDHDQRGVVGADSGESYRVALNGQGGLPACDGTQPPPATTDAGAPPAPPAADAGAPPAQDAGTPPQDAGTPTPDANVDPPDVIVGI